MKFFSKKDPPVQDEFNSEQGTLLDDASFSWKWSANTALLHAVGRAQSRTSLAKGYLVDTQTHPRSPLAQTAHTGLPPPQG